MSRTFPFAIKVRFGRDVDVNAICFAALPSRRMSGSKAIDQIFSSRYADHSRRSFSSSSCLRPSQRGGRDDYAAIQSLAD